MFKKILVPTDGSALALRAASTAVELAKAHGAQVVGVYVIDPFPYIGIGDASAAGLQNFVRTLSGAVATSLVTTSWENRTTAIHADLVGELDRSGEVMRTLTGLGPPPDARSGMLDNLLTGQSVMLATNQILWIVAALFLVSAFAIWLAPRPTRTVEMSEAGH